MKAVLGIFAVLSVLAGLAEAGADGTMAEYELKFVATWSAATHPTDFPSTPHFSGLIGGTHNDSVRFWELGGLATLGLERVAEMGQKDVMIQEVNAAIADGTAWSLFSRLGIAPSPGTRTEKFQVSSTHPLATIVTMIAPTPDWFVGVSALNLRENDQWRDEIVIDLDPYDAGTDSGVTFESPNADTNPREPISRLDGFPFENAPPLGTFTFTLLSVSPPTPGDMDGDGSVDFDDVEGFSLGLHDPAGYEETFGLAAGIRGDMDGDGDLDFDDIHGFVSLLSSPSQTVRPVVIPEPGTLYLAILGLLGITLGRWGALTA